MCNISYGTVPNYVECGMQFRKNGVFLLIPHCPCTYLTRFVVYSTKIYKYHVMFTQVAQMLHVATIHNPSHICVDKKSNNVMGNIYITILAK